MRRVVGAALLAAACGGCAGPAQKASTEVLPPEYDATQLALDRYTVVKRLGVQSWRSAFYIPGYPDEPSARRAALTEAAQAHADGVINVHCLGQTDALFRPRGYYCYGNAIRLK